MRLIDLAATDQRDNLDDYIETHIHGPLRLATDVEALVLDPCFRGTVVEAFALELPCSLEWHPGFRLHVDDMALYPSCRGPEYVALGRSLAVDGWLTPAVLEVAVRTERHHPQDLKKVWHYLALRRSFLSLTSSSGQLDSMRPQRSYAAARPTNPAGTEANMSIEHAVRHARRSVRWALVSAILSTAFPILALVGDASRWISLAATAYAVFAWATFFLQRRAHRAAFSERPANVHWR